MTAITVENLAEFAPDGPKCFVMGTVLRRWKISEDDLASTSDNDCDGRSETIEPPVFRLDLENRRRTGRAAEENIVAVDEFNNRTPSRPAKIEVRFVGNEARRCQGLRPNDRVRIALERDRTRVHCTCAETGERGPLAHNKNGCYVQVGTQERPEAESGAQEGAGSSDASDSRAALVALQRPHATSRRDRSTQLVYDGCPWMDIPGRSATAGSAGSVDSVGPVSTASSSSRRPETGAGTFDEFDEFDDDLLSAPAAAPPRSAASVAPIAPSPRKRGRRPLSEGRPSEGRPSADRRAPSANDATDESASNRRGFWSENASVERKKRRCAPYVYTPMADLQRGRANVYGVVVGCSLPKRGRFDWYCTLTVTDRSLANRRPPAEPISVNVFARTLDALPRPQSAGDVVRFHSVDVVQWNGKTGFCSKMKPPRIVIWHAAEARARTEIGPDAADTRLETAASVPSVAGPRPGRPDRPAGGHGTGGHGTGGHGTGGRPRALPAATSTTPNFSLTPRDHDRVRALLRWGAAELENSPIYAEERLSAVGSLRPRTYADLLVRVVDVDLSCRERSPGDRRPGSNSACGWLPRLIVWDGSERPASPSAEGPDDIGAGLGPALIVYVACSPGLVASEAASQLAGWIERCGAAGEAGCFVKLRNVEVLGSPGDPRVRGYLCRAKITEKSGVWRVPAAARSVRERFPRELLERYDAGLYERFGGPRKPPAARAGARPAAGGAPAVARAGGACAGGACAAPWSRGSPSAPSAPSAAGGGAEASHPSRASFLARPAPRARTAPRPDPMREDGGRTVFDGGGRPSPSRGGGAGGATRGSSPPPRPPRAAGPERGPGDDGRRRAVARSDSAAAMPPPPAAPGWLVRTPPLTRILRPGRWTEEKAAVAPLHAVLDHADACTVETVRRGAWRPRLFRVRVRCVDFFPADVRAFVARAGPGPRGGIGPADEADASAASAPAAPGASRRRSGGRDAGRSTDNISRGHEPDARAGTPDGWRYCFLLKLAALRGDLSAHVSGPDAVDFLQIAPCSLSANNISREAVERAMRRLTAEGVWFECCLWVHRCKGGSALETTRDGAEPDVAFKLCETRIVRGARY